MLTDKDWAQEEEPGNEAEKGQKELRRQDLESHEDAFLLRHSTLHPLLTQRLRPAAWPPARNPSDMYDLGSQPRPAVTGLPHTEMHITTGEPLLWPLPDAALVAFPMCYEMCVLFTPLRTLVSRSFPPALLLEASVSILPSL